MQHDIGLKKDRCVCGFFNEVGGPAKGTYKF